MSTASGSSRGRVFWWLCSADMFDPIFMVVQLAADGLPVEVLQLAGDRPRAAVADHPVIDRADRHDLGRRPGEKRLLGQVQVGAQEVADLDVEAEVPGQGEDAALGDAF